MSESVRTRASDDPEYARNLRRASLASSVGSALEYYDFAVYSNASALVLATLFFPDVGGAKGLAASFATFAVGFFARPVGGVVFGALGDRLGRRFVLVTTVVLMGASSTLIGVLPTAAQVGVLAPVLLVVLRVLQGLGAGAEQAGATTLMAEYSPVRRRGFYSALPFIGILLGTFLASAVFGAAGLLDKQVLLAGVWRIPFLVSAVLVVVGVVIRARLQETPTFLTLEQRQDVAKNPLGEVLRGSWRSILRGMGLRMAENGGSYLYQTLSLTIITTVAGLSSSIGPFAIAGASIVGAAVLPVAGALSDRVGRVRVYRWGALLQIVLALPSWWLLSFAPAPVDFVVLAVAYGLGVNTMLGAQCALLPELFGPRHRYSGVAIAREFSAILAGGIAPFVGALLLSAFSNSWLPIALYVVVLTAITFGTTFVTPETRARDLDADEDADRDTPQQIAARPAPVGSR